MSIPPVRQRLDRFDVHLPRVHMFTTKTASSALSSLFCLLWKANVYLVHSASLLFNFGFSPIKSVFHLARLAFDSTWIIQVESILGLDCKVRWLGFKPNHFSHLIDIDRLFGNQSSVAKLLLPWNQKFRWNSLVFYNHSLFRLWTSSVSQLQTSP